MTYIPGLPTGASTDASLTETHGTRAAGSAATKAELVGGVYNTSAPAPTNGQQVAVQLDSAGNVRTNPTGYIGSFQNVINTPAAGANGVITVPTAKKYRVLSIRVKLVTSATSATRTVRVSINDATAEIFIVNPGLTQAASLNYNYYFAPGLPFPAAGAASAVSGVNLCPAPLASIGPSFTIQTAVLNIQTGDQVTLSANLEEYSD